MKNSEKGASTQLKNEKRNDKIENNEPLTSGLHNGGSVLRRQFCGNRKLNAPNERRC